jgi:hypothetical protein
LVGPVGPVRTPPAPTSGAFRFRSYGGLFPKLWGSVARPPEGLSSRARRRPIGAAEIYRTSRVVWRWPPPRRSYSRSKFELWGALSPAPGGVSTRGRPRRKGAVEIYPRTEFGVAGPRRSDLGSGRTSTPVVADGHARESAPFPAVARCGARSQCGSCFDVCVRLGANGRFCGLVVQNLSRYRLRFWTLQREKRLQGLFRAISVPERGLSGGVGQDPSAPCVRFSILPKSEAPGPLGPRGIRRRRAISDRPCRAWTPG